MSEIRTCLWFERDGEAAARFYVSLIPDSAIEHVQHAPADTPGAKRGEALLVDFRLGAQRFQALNGGSREAYGNATSISVLCATQAEVDRLWSALTADGGSDIACGWLRDRWGVPWQIVPEALPRLLRDPEVHESVFAAMLTMTRLDIAKLEQAASAARSP